MTVTTYQGWVNDGKPWKNCQPINDFIATLQRHGYTGPTAGIGDQSHLTATPPEDHCPYSHTPWPGVQPYPYVMAIDIMGGEGLDLIRLGGLIFNDKNSNVPGTEPIKYMNWTDSDNNCFHDSWQPNHTRYNSSDRGHIHISFRTDYVTSNRMAIYDPYGGTPTPPPGEDDDMGMHYVAVSDGSGSIYLAPGYAAPSGRMAAYGLNKGTYAAYHAIVPVANTVTMDQASVDLYYDLDPQPWPAGGGSGPVPSPGNYTINLSGVASPE